MHPAAVAVGVIAVDRLFGVVGLIVSVPILVTATIFIDELWTKPMEQNHAIVATGRDEHTAAELVPITSATAARSATGSAERRAVALGARSLS
jgi:ABC-type transport system involved in cytochrome c biogenesis permease component